ncbi:hypothetical protein HNO52_16880 [Billgrantia diversa]|uniref:BCCT family transporter n=1 Tax=Halomonas sp. MCCC 1A13316 TaxID=2733487 RepID=UPI0018A612AF|nr:hypothetical protein HNO52_16880 [Halomonas sp. MCCC 1A13316]
MKSVTATTQVPSATGQFSWLYLLIGLKVVIFLVALTVSRYGDVRLGEPAITRPNLSV